MKVLRSTATALAALALSSAALAAPLVLTFEGIGDVNPVGNFYAGLGVTFSPATLAVVDSDAGGSGNIANEPSPSTVMFFLDGNDAILNYAAGFDIGFSFFYSSNSDAASVDVYDDVNATGNLLASIPLVRQFNNSCQGDPNGAYCNWTPVGVAFAGIAKSIDFGGTANFIAFDNITFRSATPGIPEPASLALVGAALVGLGIARRRRA